MTGPVLRRTGEKLILSKMKSRIRKGLYVSLWYGFFDAALPVSDIPLIL